MESGLLISDRYRLRDRLGFGGMSVVWRADDDLLGREVAIKALTARLADDPDLLRRVRAEARAAAGLRHPNVVDVYDYGETQYHGRTLPYVVMELVDGRSLAEVLDDQPIAWRQALRIGAEVAGALAAAHACGIVHRDVKPANVMVTRSGVKLVDFGVSAAVGEMDDRDGQLLGTPAYLAPERIDGGPARPATDVYALGLLIYLALAGRLPWNASTTTQMLKAHRYVDPAPLPRVDGLPAPAVRLVARCLAKDPAERPSAAEVADALRQFGGLQPTAELTILRPAGPAAAGRPSRRTRIGTAATLAGLAAAGLAVWAGWPESAAPAAGSTAAAVPAASCTVRYAMRGGTDRNASTAVTILNTGREPIDAWKLRFALPAGQRLLRGWTGGWEQNGAIVNAGGGSLPVNGQVSTGFDAVFTPPAALPITFDLNGIACRAEMSVQSATAAVPPLPKPTVIGKTLPAPTEPAAKNQGKHKGHGNGNEDGDEDEDED